MKRFASFGGCHWCQVGRLWFYVLKTDHRCVYFKGKWTIHSPSYCSNNFQVKEHVEESAVACTLSTTPSITPKTSLLVEFGRLLRPSSVSRKQLPVCKSTKIQRCIYVEKFAKLNFPSPRRRPSAEQRHAWNSIQKLNYSEHKDFFFLFLWGNYQIFISVTTVRACFCTIMFFYAYFIL